MAITKEEVTLSIIGSSDEIKQFAEFLETQSILVESLVQQRGDDVVMVITPLNEHVPQHEWCDFVIEAKRFLRNLSL